MSVNVTIQISGPILGASLSSLAALGQQAPFTVDSPSSLVAAVQSEMARRAAMCPSPPCPSVDVVPEWSAAAQAAPEPLTLLHAIGRATSQWSPAVALVSLASWWAAIRYLLAFDLSIQGVRFSDAALALRYHQRQAFSEYLGIGAAITACEAHIFGRSAHIADADMPPAGSVLPSRPARGLWPDYYLYGSQGHPVVVLECKGNSGNPGLRVRQLARGACQASQPAVPASAVRRLAIGTVTHAGQRWFDCAAVELAESNAPGLDSLSDSRTRWRESAFRATASKALGWAGAYQEAATMYASGEILRDAARPVDTAVGPLVAQRHTIFGLDVITGVELETYQALRTRDLDALEERVTSRARLRISDDPDRTIPFRVIREGGTWSIADDGSVLGVGLILGRAGNAPVEA